ncbi:trithorax group protein osa-like isoform X1 [Penaeus monodon]|uniref:trithorax group protein osa-like isoform X1 n=1 Tax=Penaeus monodon TaxID=6687 RepID=UPI0018A7C7A0|nr:trithorax group protein osa-like isoform X1 [Penaeus monodon]
MAADPVYGNFESLEGLRIDGDDDPVYGNHDTLIFRKIIEENLTIDNIIGSRYQPPPHFPASRPPPSSQAAEQAKGGSEWVHVIDSDDGWSSDEFDDITEQDSVNASHDVSNSNITSVADPNDDNELYMTPSPATSAPSYPNQQPRTLSKPSVSPPALPFSNNVPPHTAQKGFPSPGRGTLVNRIGKNPPFSGGSQAAGPRGQTSVDPPRRDPPAPPGSRGPAPTPAFNVPSKGPVDLARRVPPSLPGHLGSTGSQEGPRWGPIQRAGSPKTVGGPPDISRRGPVPLATLGGNSDMSRPGPPLLPVLPKGSTQAGQTDNSRRGPAPVPGHLGLQEQQSSVDITRRAPMPLPGSPTIMQQGPAVAKTNCGASEVPNAPPARVPTRPPPRVNSPNNSRPVSPNSGVGRGSLSSQPQLPSLRGNSNEASRPEVRKTNSLNETINRFNRLSQATSYTPEEFGHEYEVVEAPRGSFANQDNSASGQQNLPSASSPPALPPRNQGAREAGRRGTGGSQSPTHQLPLPTHGLGQVRPQNGVPQPPQLPTLPPPPIPKQTPKQYNRPSQPHVHPTNPQYLDHPPTEMAPAVPGYTGGSTGIGGHPKPGAERVPREDGGMVELTPLYRSIFDRPYFHIISRNKSRELLEKAEDGVFLIRPSTRSSDPLTLCLRYRSRTYNINIRCRPDGLFALGSEKTNEMTFSSVDDIVTTYTREPIKLQSGDRAMLTVPPPKSDHIYVKMPLPKVLGCQEIKMPM